MSGPLPIEYFRNWRTRLRRDIPQAITAALHFIFVYSYRDSRLEIVPTEVEAFGEIHECAKHSVGIGKLTDELSRDADAIKSARIRAAKALLAIVGDERLGRSGAARIPSIPGLAGRGKEIV
jgi:hypothetical protein